jgi:phosphatidylethanolamine/phosphatidyl-N-methylethanolamine N-methyltransferase
LKTITYRRPGSEILRYLREFAINPETTGSVAPSSNALAKEIVRGIDLANATAVLEYGPGTGVFTPYVLRQVPYSCKFVAIELNPSFAKHFRATYPDVSLHQGNVADARRICDENGIGNVDCIVSGLPWASFSIDKQATYLDATVEVLKPGGYFTTFALLHGLLLPSGRRFATMLRNHFTEVTMSRVIWSNFPPAIVYKCRL